ncbi:hypothetical protein NUW58_g4866 [Xylaria curta]|uniref:Uncharacterized protein n=1 Tax=Xylaria curta TaxID=42375 RepID=A0ACC1P774_9PEZI|nr:hypothetical protein NUW58_g4866 [Xylaria curta]
MTKSWAKLLAIPALLAGAAQALHFTNVIPVESYYEIGSEFVLQWEPEARTDGFKLDVFSFLGTPILVSPNGGPLGGPIYDYQSQTVLLGNDVKFNAGNFTWVVAPISGRTGAEWYYSFGASWQYGSTSPRAFHLKAAS